MACMPEYTEQQIIDKLNSFDRHPYFSKKELFRYCDIDSSSIPASRTLVPVKQILGCLNNGWIASAWRGSKHIADMVNYMASTDDDLNAWDFPYFEEYGGLYIPREGKHRTASAKFLDKDVMEGVVKKSAISSNKFITFTELPIMLVRRAKGEWQGKIKFTKNNLEVAADDISLYVSKRYKPRMLIDSCEGIWAFAQDSEKLRRVCELQEVHGQVEIVSTSLL